MQAKMKPLKILNVNVQEKTLFADSVETVRFYTVETDGEPGHNIFHQSEYRFDGVPLVGMYMQNVTPLSLTCGIYWRIFAQKQK